jgi:quinoprotein glucose dehydrogenase
MARFKLPEGWKVELVAAEPLLANPVCFYLDYDGKTAYVGETFRHHKGVTDIRDHMDWNDDDLAARTVEDRIAYFKKHLGDKFPDFEKACERVRLLRDTDGDGVFDAARVFSDRFRDAAAGIGASLLSYRGDVFYTCIPSLWRLRDTNGDGRADEERELSTGYGVHVALLGHDLHGLRIGPDGKLYFSIGDRGLNVPLPDGSRLEYPQAGGVLRCNLDGSDLELFANGMRNPQDLIFDAYGNLFTGDNNSDGGDKARLVHVVEGADSGWRQAYQWINEPDVRGPWNDEKQWWPYPDNQVAAILPPIANLADGPSGITINPGSGMSAGYAGWLFLADFRGGASYSGVRGFELVPKGAGFTLGKHEETWWGVLATDVDIGTDGAMYVSDWTEGWNQTGKGRF